MAVLSQRPAGQESARAGNGADGTVTVTRDELQHQLSGWHSLAQRYHLAHLHGANANHRQARLFGWAITVLTAVVGTSFVTELGNSSDVWAKATVAALAAGVAVLTAIQQYAKPADEEAQHRSASVKFGELQLEIEKWWAIDAKGAWTKKSLEKAIAQWLQQFTAAEGTAPALKVRWVSWAQDEIEHAQYDRIPEEFRR